MSLCYVLFVLVIAFVLCFISVHQCPLVAFYWCLLSSPCRVLLVLVVALLLHFVDVHYGPLQCSIYACHHPFATFY